jgi:S-adenosylmethionine:tRNA ribosyltransferase-isomerase
LFGVHAPTGAPIEIRLAGWIVPGDPTRFVAIAFGAGDFRTRTEHRLPPPTFAPGDHLVVGPLRATVTELLDHPRLLRIRFRGDCGAVLAGLARHGRPIQYAHIAQPLVLWDVWTKFAAVPLAFEAPSAGFAIDWRTVNVWRERGVTLTTLTHAAGISSTGDPALDVRLPFDEHFCISPATVAAVAQARARGGHVIAIGTTVVRALESAAAADGIIRAGAGIARGRIGPQTQLRVVDAILTGAHEPGESHFELLRAFADDEVLDKMSAALDAHHYRGHEFGDSVLIERTPARVPDRTCPRCLEPVDERSRIVR